MNNVNLERIPLPRFSTYLIYTAVSLAGSIVRLLYIVSHTPSTAPNGSVNTTVTFNKMQIGWSPLIQVCVDDTWFFWSVINFAYCLLICLGRKLQHFFFGELRAAENSHIRENLSNFIFYKVVFVYGILNVEALHELLLWAAWFSVLGFLHLLAALAKDRFEFLMQSPDAPLLHIPMVILLCALLFFGNILMAISIAVGTRYSIHLMFFMLAEVFQLGVITTHVLVWYAIQLYTEATQMIDVNNLYHKSTSLYYVEMIFSSILDLGDLVHNVHLLFWNHLRVNMSGIIVGMHLQHLYYKLSERYRHHVRYRRVLNLLTSSLKQVELPDQDCAVCWETLKDARELPCGHAFHLACLHMWLERSAHCPTCRAHLDALDAEAEPFATNREHLNSVRTATTVTTTRTTTLGTSCSVVQSHGNRIGASSAIASHGDTSEWTDNDDIDYTGCDSDDIASALPVQQRQLKVEPFSTCSSHLAYSNSSGRMFFSMPEYGHSSDAMSAMVSINRLLDVSNEPHNSSNGVGIPTHFQGTTLPTNKFFDALEAELLHYFQPPVGCNETNASSIKSMNPDDLKDYTIETRSRKAMPTITVTAENLSDHSPNAVENHPISDSTPYRFSQPQTANYLEFPPKRVLRMAIRHLIHRVTQAAAAARAVGAHVTSRTSSSSDVDSSDPEVADTGHRQQRSNNTDLQRLPSVSEPYSPVNTPKTRLIGDPHQPQISLNNMQTAHPGCNVFYNSRELREQSLQQRKLAIRTEARRNFLLRHCLHDP